jgi:protein-disulfide isomerase
MEENNLEKKGKNSQKQIAGAIIIAGVIIAGAILLKGNGSPVIKDLTKSSPVFNQCLDSGKYAQVITDSKNAGATAGVTGTPKGFILRDGKIVATIDGAEPAEMVKQKIDAALAGTSKTIDSIKLAPVTNSDFILDGGSEAKVTVIVYTDFQCPFCGKFFKETEQTLINNYIKSGEINFVYRDFAFLGPESEKSAEAARCAGEQGQFWAYHDYLFNHQNGENQGAFADPNLKTFAGTLKLK